MKRFYYLFLGVALCVALTVFAAQNSSDNTLSVAQNQHQKELKTLKQQQRAERRAARIAEYERYIDSIILSKNFEFNPQSIQMQPAGQMRFLSNAVYTMTLWDGQLDICMPYYVGYVPPYRYVLLNTGVPSVEDYMAVRTEEGWHITFKTTLYASSDYTFSLEVNHRYGGATLTIDNLWYNPVQYTGSITRIY
ncbi:MAG: DUF4251 domain-containing protein [Alistipes sp.]|nr:DUF4251 domain-containing protein [Alistipes sp.]MDO5497186.1 DUF4251 domain-containing protein [Alistipes sp.]